MLFVLGSFERVDRLCSSFFFVANYTLSYSSLFVLRKKEPDMERPYRAWGYPWTTGIALAASVCFWCSVAPILQRRPRQIWPPSPASGAAMLVLSYPVFRFLKVGHEERL